MKLTFHGAARTVTGSKHLLTLDNDKKILLDCGLFQGMGAETIVLNENFGFDPKEIDYVLISHAHNDHIGLLPKLVKEGFKGPIYCTEATIALAHILLKDSAHIQEMDVKYTNKIKARKGKAPVAPLYKMEDALRVLPLMKTIRYDTWTRIDEEIEVLYTDAGHILGSACVHLKVKENNKTIRISFSGDIGRRSDPLLRPPTAFPQADYILMESTYGNRLHPPPESAPSILFDEIQRTCIENGGKLIIPAFSVGRTQEILFAINQFTLERRLPAIDYYVDSPMSVEVTKTIKQFNHLFNERVQEILKKDQDPFDFPGLKMLVDVQDSKALNFNRKPCVIISASGMAEAGRVKHHIANNIENPNNTILIVGYCEPESLGGRMAAGREEVTIFGQPFKVNAKVSTIQSLSAHGDYLELQNWLSCQDAAQVRKVFLVHGDYESQQKLSDRLNLKGFKDIEIPKLHQEFNLDT